MSTKIGTRKRRHGIWSMLNNLKSMEPEGTLDSLKKKIYNMRTCYRRELKQKKSVTSGAGSDDLYEPTLCYFEDLGFLRDQETLLPRTINLNNDIEISVIHFLPIFIKV